LCSAAADNIELIIEGFVRSLQPRLFDRAGVAQVSISIVSFAARSGNALAKDALTR
jgi:hypothetical protein